MSTRPNTRPRDESTHYYSLNIRALANCRDTTMLPGGPADKIGNRYETWWTVSELVRMIRGNSDAIRIEVPGVDKAEFVVKSGSCHEFHQVKRSHSNGKWSLSALRADGLMSAMGRTLAGNQDRFVFASGSEARELTDLCEAVRDAATVAEFEDVFLTAEGRRQGFQKLCDCWKCDVPTTVERLKRIEVHTIDERQLEEKVRWGVQALFLADPHSVVEVLRTLVTDSVHSTITRENLVQQLDRRGYSLRRLTSPESAITAVQTATDHYLDGVRRRLIRHRLIPREAAKALLSKLDGTETVSVLTGGAGSGKTACVVQIVDALRARGLPVLAFRLDRHMSASTTTALGSRLDLEESPVLVLATAASAAVRTGVLIVDQLDAVSTMSGRNSAAFELVEQLVHEIRGTQAHAKIQTVVVCRAFDWNNDYRLRQLVPDSQDPIEVAEFTVDEVKKVLDGAGFDPTLFKPSQVELLRLPQNLYLFLEIGFDTSSAPAFDRVMDLYNRYWEEKRRSAAARAAPTPDEWMAVIKTVCNEMNATQRLAVPKEKLDTVSQEYLHQLASEGVLTFDGRCYGFGHESFFDYCFARLFVARSDTVVSFLQASEQHLFRRAQVRQVLTYLRDADFDRYVRELRALLSDSGIRPHLKDLAFALLAGVTNPKEEEWAIWEEWMTPALASVDDKTHPDKLSARAWQRFCTATGWLDFADRRGVVEGWLTSDNPRLVDTVVGNYLRIHQQHAPERVAALLEPYTEHGGLWALRLRYLMQWADLHTSRRFFDLFLRLVHNGVLDDARGPVAMNSTFWDLLYPLGKNRPEWIPEVLACRLRRRLAVMRAAGKNLCSGEILGYAHAAAEMLLRSAEQAPAAFVKHVLPVILQISDAALTGDTPPRRDTVWPWLMRISNPSDEAACLSGLASALAALASKDANDLHNVIAGLRSRDTYVSNHLLLALYRGGAARYADEAVALLCAKPWRVECGFIDNPRWCAIETIQVVVPHCTLENRERLEAVILKYVSPYERTKNGYASHGHARFALLSAIPADLRSPGARKHIQELTRKFGEPEGEPRRVTVERLTSPIKKTAADKMTDDQWLRAIRKYDSGGLASWSDNEDHWRALELARDLGARVKEDPARFARLSLSFPAAANPVYMQEVLRALKDAAAPYDLKLQVCRKAYADARSPCGAVIAEVLGSTEDPLPDDAVRMLHWIATEHGEPAKEAWQEDAGGGQPYYGGDILTNGINTARGRAAEVIMSLILTDAAYIDRFRFTLDQIVRDRSPAVLSCVAGTLRAVAYRDAALGKSLFQNMNLSEDRLLATRHVDHFLRNRLHEDFAELQPIIERMLRSSDSGVQKTGARLASFAVLLHGNSAVTFVEKALNGGTGSRLGVAEVAAANCAVPEYRVWCRESLVAFFDDDEADVRLEAASCFRKIGDDALDESATLITAFCDSRAYQDDSDSLLRVLEQARGRLPGEACLACEKFLDRFAGEATDIRTKHAVGAHTLAKLVFRTYQQHQHDRWTYRSLDLIDRLYVEGIVDVHGEMEEFER